MYDKNKNKRGKTMQKSGATPQSVRHRVKTSTVKSRGEVQRPAKSVDVARPRVIISKNRTMASMPQMKKRNNMIIEHSMEPEIIPAPRMVEVEDEVPEDVELITPISDSDSELMPMNVSKMSAKEMKERAIAKALSEAARPNEKKVVERPMRTNFNWARVILAFVCAAMAVFAIVYFVNLSSPDFSMTFAASRAGIDALYPSYVPRDYSLSDVTSGSGKSILNFRNSSEGTTFSITEEKSVWDSNSLLANYVRPEYGDDFTVIRESDLTLYISDSDAAWVNGGVVFKLKATPGLLTKKQIKTIAESIHP